MSIRSLLQTALNRLSAGEPLVLVTVAASQGSTPRSAGAWMLVGQQGLLCGTIGGGALEYHCQQLAASLAPGSPGRLETFSLTDAEAGGLGMICGGSTQVLFTPLSDPSPFAAAQELLLEGSSAWLCLPLDGSAPQVVSAPEGQLPAKAQTADWEGKAVLALPLREPGRFFLIGAGHVARELGRLLEQLEYPYLVADDRPDFACRERFAGALACLTLSCDRLGEGLCGPFAPTAQDGFCIMTRGHQGDLDAVRFALGTPAGYIGLMGGRQKRQQIFAQLESEGFSDARQRIQSPIGLDISAQTPAEIAVSVAAQLIAWRNQK